MNPVPTRIIVYPKDVRNITGRCYRYSRELLCTIRRRNGKGPKDLVTLEEFCRHTGLSEEFVRPFLN